MSHELDFSKGFAAFAEVKSNTPAWHGLGKIVEAMTPKEALELAGLNFHVEKTPNIHSYPGTVFPDVLSDESFFTWRTDTGKILGASVGGYYTPLQNEAAFALLEPLCEMGMKVETAGAIFDGRTIFALMRLGDYKVAGMDQVLTYFLLTNSHDGSKTVTGALTDVRVVCNNTLSAALNGLKKKHAIKVRHTTNVEKMTEQAINILLQAQHHQEAAQETFTRLAETEWSQKKFFDYVANVFLDKAERKAWAAGDENAISSRKGNLLGRFFDYANNGPGQKEWLGTAWGAYNAVTGYLNTANYRNADTRMTSLLWGQSSWVNDTALELACVPEKIESLGRSITPDALLN